MTKAWMGAALLAIVFCAVPGTGWSLSRSEVKTGSIASLSSTQTALELPFSERLSILASQGPSGYQNLVQLMFDTSKPMEIRWRAVTAAGRVGGRGSVEDLERALKHKEWFMRNAALIALKNVDRDKAVVWARRLLSDKALIVRSAAVEVISQLRDFASTDTLWKKLYAKENFKGQSSLFIRRRIVETLSTMETAGREGHFVKVLSDADASLHMPAISALERITQKSIGQGQSMQTRRAQWQKWWQARANQSGSELGAPQVF